MPLELEPKLELSIHQAVAVKFAGRINAEGVSEISWVACTHPVAVMSRR